MKVKDTCTGCGRCIPLCPARALTLESALAEGWGRKSASVAGGRCCGCGHCLPSCPRQALTLAS